MGAFFDHCCGKHPQSSSIYHRQRQSRPTPKYIVSRIEELDEKYEDSDARTSTVPDATKQIEKITLKSETPKNQEFKTESPKSNRKSKPRSLADSALFRLEENISHENIKDVYVFGKVIGGGHFGSVRIAYPYTNPDKRFAVKSILKEQLKSDVHLMERELQILKEVDHPNIIKFYEIYSDGKYFHIVTELCTGGELFERIVQKGRFSENAAARIIQKILSAIKHLHERSICHRDLKPENFLFENNSKDAEIKLIDFGLAKKYAKNSKLTTIVGTPYYVAPEVLKGSYDSSCDLWSVGVILFIMLCGYPPFEGDNNKDIFRKIVHCKLVFEEQDWQTVSDEAKDLIRKLLNPNPKERLSAEVALSHPWFKIIEMNPKNKVRLDPEVLKRLSKFQAPRRFQKEVLTVLVNHLSHDEIKSLREAFKAIDTDNDGDINLEELKAAFVESGISPKQGDFEALLSRIDLGGDGDITYREFLTAAIDSKCIISKEKLWSAFKHFDTDNNGFVSPDDLMIAFQREGRKLSEKELTDMMQEADLQKDGVISFDEFCKMMKDGANENKDDDQANDISVISQNGGPASEIKLLNR